MPDDYQVPAIALIAALMLAFAYLHSRFRSMRTLLWMLALGFSGLQSILRWMADNWTASPAGSHAVARLEALHWIDGAAESCLILCSALFLASLSPTSFRFGRYRVLFVVPYIIPVLLYVALYFCVSQHPTGALLRLYIFLAYWAAGAGIVWGLQKGAIPTWLAASIVVLAALASMPFFSVGNVSYPLMIVESGNMLMSALLVLFTFRRLSPGVLLATTGFLAYTLSPLFMIDPTPTPSHALLLLTRGVDLGKVVVAIGLILLVLEDEVEKNETARQRERRVRLELEVYARQSLTARSLGEFDRNSGQLCAMIAGHSCFSGAAMVVRNSAGAFSMVGYAGIDGATAGALDNLAQRLPASLFIPPGPNPLGELDETQSPPEEYPSGPTENTLGPSPEIRPALAAELLVPGSSSLGLDLTPWLLPGDDLERLHLTRVAAVPMFGPMQGPMRPSSDGGAADSLNGPDGALLLTAPRIPLTSLRADDMLPLEILAARLQAARTQAMMLGKLIDSERFAGVGQLANNVAQQLNNPLTVILGYSTLLEDAAGQAAGLSMENRAAETIGVEARRMKAILARLARFSRISTERFNSFNIADLIGDIEQMHRTDFLRHSIEFRVAVQADMPPIFGNAHQIRQALLHATQYAIDSVLRVGANREKSIRIDASTVEGAHVQIVISHSGPGFSHPDRAFDSLTSGFTGAEATGIGLSLAAAIVREHRGNITALNLQTTGAAIQIDLPIG